MVKRPPVDCVQHSSVERDNTGGLVYRTNRHGCLKNRPLYGRLLRQLVIFLGQRLLNLHRESRKLLFLLGGKLHTKLLKRLSLTAIESMYAAYDAGEEMVSITAVCFFKSLT